MMIKHYPALSDVAQLRKYSNGCIILQFAGIAAKPRARTQSCSPTVEQTNSARLSIGLLYRKSIEEEVTVWLCLLQQPEPKQNQVNLFRNPKLVRAEVIMGKRKSTQRDETFQKLVWQEVSPRKRSTEWFVVFCRIGLSCQK
ncbi:unnamed protein product [Amoebophrya sp. A120]|nr:unnamed protein product [Amoebophrya sp. A120]|eukprot:GSA120T00022172001.1